MGSVSFISEILEKKTNYWSNGLIMFAKNEGAQHPSKREIAFLEISTHRRQQRRYNACFCKSQTHIRLITNNWISCRNVGDSLFSIFRNPRRLVVPCPIMITFLERFFIQSSCQYLISCFSSRGDETPLQKKVIVVDSIAAPLISDTHIKRASHF